MTSATIRLRRALNRLFRTHRWRNASIDHSIFETLESCALLHLRLLKFAKQFVFHSFELHALLLELTNLISHLSSLHIHVVSGLGSLLLDEVVLLLQTLRLGFTDLLLAVLGIIVVVFTHSIQVMFNLFLLSSHFLNSCQLLVPEVFVSEMHLLFLLHLTLLHSLLLSFYTSLALLLFSLFHENAIVILILKILQLSCLFLSFFNLLHCTHLFVLEHADAIPQKFDIALQLQTDRASLVER